MGSESAWLYIGAGTIGELLIVYRRSRATKQYSLAISNRFMKAE